MTAIVRLHLPADRAAFEQHFGALSDEDLRLRFCTTVARESVVWYLDRLQQTGLPSYGIFNPGLELVALGQFARISPSEPALEVGLSVLEHYRRKGLAAALLNRAASYARSRRMKELVVHCLADNAPMLSLARRIGMEFHVSGGDADGRLRLRAGTALDFWREVAYDQEGIADSVAKRWRVLVRELAARPIPRTDS
jgi:GNAT superfamily N-acetyltransferase